MDQENRKLYNQQYYQTNKANILQKLTSKVNCEFCNRQVSYANLNKHFTFFDQANILFKSSNDSTNSLSSIINRNCCDMGNED